MSNRRSGIRPLPDPIPIKPWPDQIIDTLGHDPRSTYVETFWLGILGPSSTWLLRHIARAFDHDPSGFELPISDTARRLGLGAKTGRQSTFTRAFNRLVQFDLACYYGDGLQVRRKVPPLNRRQLHHLPEPLQEAHEHWQDALRKTPPVEQMRRRSRQLALSLLELGEDVEATERQLMRWRYHPAMCRESVAWAWDRHRAAQAAAGEAPAEAAS